MSRGLDLVWVVDDPSVDVPEGMRAVARRTPGWFEALAGAHAYVSNAAAPPWFAKKPGQVHLQTWHGTPLKRIGEDRGPGDLNTWRHRRSLARQAARWDGFVSPSPFCSEIFRSAFSYDGPMLEIGYPRNDLLLSGRAPERAHADPAPARDRRRPARGPLRAHLARVPRRPRQQAVVPRPHPAGRRDARCRGAGPWPLQRLASGRRVPGRARSSTSRATPTSPTSTWPRTRWSPTTPR